MKLSQFLAPDQVTLDAAHGEHYHAHSNAENGLDASYRNERDRLEQAHARRICTDPDYRAQFVDMTWKETEDWLDAHCGKRPGRQKYKNAYNKRKREKSQHGGSRKQEVPEGMMVMLDAANALGVSVRAVYHYMTTGAKRKGQVVRLCGVKHGKLHMTRPEWIEAFRNEAWWLPCGVGDRGVKEDRS